MRGMVCASGNCLRSGSKNRMRGDDGMKKEETQSIDLRCLSVAACVAIVLLLHSATAFGAVVTSPTCGRNDVGAAVSAARDGDTIAIPAGRCTWTNNLTITNKLITLQGAGIDQTTIVDGVSKALFPNIPQVLTLNAKDGGLTRITGITFQGGTTDDPYNKGMVAIQGVSSQLRVDHCRFVPTKTTGLTIYGYIRGVADHNIIDLSASRTIGMYVHHNVWNIPGSDFGDASWASPSSIGTAEAMFVEDNVFTNDQSGFPWKFAFDGWMGSRVVFRYNTFTNAVWSNHGTDSGGRWRGMRQYEVYNNKFALTNAAGVSTLVGSRGGAGVVHNNTATLTSGAFIGQFSDMSVYRQNHLDVTYSPWGSCVGTSQWDGNSDRSGYPCLDQPGRGQGGVLSGVDPTPAGWPNQAIDPVYAWNNTVNGSPGQLISLAPAVVVENRDFYNGVKPGYLPYRYPHPLVGSSPSSVPAPANLRIR